jgi:hypothetical protein
MAAGGKKKIKLALKYDILKFDKMDTKNASDFIASNKDLAKLVKPLEFKVDAELDEKKYDAKKLEDVVYYGDKGGVFGIRMAVKLFDMAVAEAKKKNRPDDVKKAYAELEKDSKYAFEKLMKDLESGKADNAGALKDGKAAMNKLDAVKSNSFEDPRKGAIKALEALTKANADKGAAAKANKALTTIKTLFDKSGKEAEKAVDFLMSTGKKMKDDKDADQALKDFGKEVLKQEKVFEAFLDGAYKFGEAFDEAITATEAEEVDAGKARDLIKSFEELSSLEKKAAAAVQCANKLRPKFKSIESKLK